MAGLSKSITVFFSARRFRQTRIDDCMMVVGVTGGLGNQLFTYALARKLAVLHQREIVLDLTFLKNKESCYALDYFNIIPHRFYKAPKKIKRFWNHKIHKNRFYPLYYYQEQGVTGFDPKVLELPDDVYISGYWGKEKYFKDIRNVLLQELTLRHVTTAYMNVFLEKIAAVNAVCVHVRRGDYVVNPAAAAFHGTCGIQYYQEAVQKIKHDIDHPVFFVFSNDIAWAKKNLPFIEPVIFIGDERVCNRIGDKRDYEDFHLMRSCKHFIIANSTFSWWAAWLSTASEKKVIAPKQWFADPNIVVTDQPENWNYI